MKKPETMPPHDARDLLAEEQSPDVIAAAVRQLLALGYTREQILGEVPTLPESVVRRASAA